MQAFMSIILTCRLAQVTSAKLQDAFAAAVHGKVPFIIVMKQHLSRAESVANQTGTTD